MQARAWQHALLGFRAQQQNRIVLEAMRMSPPTYLGTFVCCEHACHYHLPARPCFLRYQIRFARHWVQGWPSAKSQLPVIKPTAMRAGGQKCLAQQSQQVLKVLLHPEPQAFTFDMVAGEAADQDAIFRGACPQVRVLNNQP